MDTRSKEQLQKILARFPQSKESIIPLLQEIQQYFNYLPEEAMEKAAEHLRVSPSVVYGVATFYKQFKLTPRGKHSIKICRGTACHVQGGSRILDEIQRKLNAKDGETTEDLKYSIDTVACIGACALAPVMILDEEVYGKLNAGKALDILSKNSEKSTSGCKCDGDGLL